jgi:arylsulfatase A-like enzyme
MFLAVLLTLSAVTFQAQKPNVILIVADDLGYADVGFHGSEIRTPNIDSLAISGTRLNRFYGHCVCTPGRSALISGIYPYKTGTQNIIWPWSTHGVPTTIDTVANVFQKQGYQTWAFGKWHLGHATPDYRPLQRGFDHHIGNYTGCIDPLNHTYYNLHDFNEDGKPIYPDGYVADIITDSLLSRIKTATGPFFAYLAYTTPHIPYGAPPQYLVPYKYESALKYRSDYAAMVTHMDDTIGRVLQALRDAKLDNNTYIWFVSDNGGWLDYAASNVPLRGGKITMYEGGVRLVSFIKGPGIPSKQSVSQPIHAVDVLPTLCHFAAIPQPVGKDGLDMYDYITDNTKQLNHRNFIFYLSGSRDKPHGAMRQGKYKLIMGPEVELYDLDTDPSETTNIRDSLDKSFMDSLISNFLKCYDDYKPDPYPLWFPPNGPPPGFVFPKYWGGPTDIPTAVFQSSQLQPVELPFHVKLGYPLDQKNYKNLE